MARAAGRTGSALVLARIDEDEDERLADVLDELEHAAVDLDDEDDEAEGVQVDGTGDNVGDNVSTGKTQTPASNVSRVKYIVKSFDPRML